LLSAKYDSRENPSGPSVSSGATPVDKDVMPVLLPEVLELDSVTFVAPKDSGENLLVLSQMSVPSSMSMVTQINLEMRDPHINSSGTHSTDSLLLFSEEQVGIESLEFCDFHSLRVSSHSQN
jgi:hypothetical protein